MGSEGDKAARDQRSAAVIGMGAVGTAQAVILARRGFKVVCVDRSQNRLDELERLSDDRSVPPHWMIGEPGLAKGFRDFGRRGMLEFTQSIDDAIDHTVAALVCVGTPRVHRLYAEEVLDLDSIDGVWEKIVLRLRHKERRSYPVVIRSTLPIGYTRKMSARVASINLGPGDGKLDKWRWRYAPRLIVYPEFLREGKALDDLEHPVMLVSGQECCARPPAIVNEMFPGAPECVTFETAEMLKLVCNAWHALKIVWANEVGSIAAAHGIDPNIIMDLFKKDRTLNISEAYLRPGMPFGGPCLGKDLNQLITHGMEVLDDNPSLLTSIEVGNKQHVRRMADRVTRFAKAEKIGIVGVAFKPGTLDCRESPSIALARVLNDRGKTVWLHEPGGLGRPNDHGIDGLPCKSEIVDHIEYLVDWADLIVLTQEWMKEALGHHVTRRRKVLLDLSWMGATIPGHESFPDRSGGVHREES